MSNCDYLVFKRNVSQETLHDTIDAINSSVFKNHLKITYPAIGDKKHCILVELSERGYGFQIWRETARTIYAEKLFTDINYWVEAVLFNELGLLFGPSYQWNDGCGNAPEDRWYPATRKYGDNTFAGYSYWRTQPFRQAKDISPTDLKRILSNSKAVYEMFAKDIPEELRGTWKD